MAHEAKELDDAMSVARANAGELAIAAGQVFAMRMALGAQAMSDPLSADHGEFAKIIPEKTSAFAHAGMTWLRWSGEVAEQMASFAACEAATVAEAVAAMSSCRTPVDVIAMQSSFTTAWLARALSQSIAPRRRGTALAQRRADADAPDGIGKRAPADPMTKLQPFWSSQSSSSS